MRQLLLMAVLATTPLSLKAQSGFYDNNTIQIIQITFSQPNWDYMMDTAAAGSESYLIAAQVVINGTAFDSVGIKYKGNSSYNANNVKNPLHIKLDYVHDTADYQGFSDVKLSNLFKDPSFVREPLSYEILRNYMHAPRSNHARVYINGTYYGIYVSSEDINKSFIGDHFYSTGGTFFKCNPVGGAGPGPGGTYPNLVYLGSDSSLFQTAYELKSDYGWNDLVAFTDSLTNQSSTIINNLDVDRALWMLAFNNVLVNLDSYTGGFSQNYYLYKDLNARMNPVVWDLNECFGAFTNSGAGNLSVTQEQQLSPVIHETNNAKPLISKLFANPEYKRRYLAHMRTILTEQFANNNYVSRAQFMQALIDSSVQADANKFYTYTQFQNSITTGVTGGMGTIPGLSQLMSARTTWLLAQSPFTATPPAISNVTPDNGSPAAGATVTITATISNVSNAVLGYRDATWKKFGYVEMYDDGLHNDGNSGDGVFGASFQVTSPQMQFYVYAENMNAGMFSPERAEHEFYILNASIPLAASGEIALNEFLAVNNTDTTDNNGAHEDWIELYNNTGNMLSVFGLYLSDDATNLSKWAFPAGTLIDPHGFLFVFADEDATTPTQLHCNFKLSSSGEELYLSDVQGNLYDYYIFGPQSADISYRRCPNGIGPWAPTLNPTPAQPNDCPTSLDDAELINPFVFYPNPASTEIHVESKVPVTETEIVDATGRVVQRREHGGVNACMLDIRMLQSGIYFIRMNHSGPYRFVKF